MFVALKGLWNESICVYVQPPLMEQLKLAIQNALKICLMNLKIKLSRTGGFISYT
jgi:hypothetical protein